MEHLTDQQRNVIRTAVLAGRRANATNGNRIILPTGQGAAANRRRYIVLSGPDGVVSPQGEYYYHLTGEHPPDRTFDYNQIPTRRGDTEYARDRSGREDRCVWAMPLRVGSWRSREGLPFSAPDGRQRARSELWMLSLIHI